MAKSFADTRGEAKKGGEYYKWVDGEQTIRLVGDIVPRYVYWKNNSNGKPTSIECLHFDRQKEKFTNVEKDWFQDAFPDQKCSWAYVGRAIHPEDSTKTILIPLKKKLYAAIQEVANELGDPTNIDKGWDCIVKREKTGSHAFNVEYTLKQLKCKTRALTETERETVSNMPNIDELVPRQSASEQKVFIQKMFFPSPDDDTDTEVDDESVTDIQE